MLKVYVNEDEYWPWLTVDQAEGYGYGTEIELTEDEFEFCKKVDRLVAVKQALLRDKQDKSIPTPIELKRNDLYVRSMKNLLLDELQAMRQKPTEDAV